MQFRIHCEHVTENYVLVLNSKFIHCFCDALGAQFHCDKTTFEHIQLTTQ